MENAYGISPSTKVYAGLTSGVIDEVELRRWATVERCGAMVMFCGMARDHSVGRPGVTKLEYEAYLEPAKARLDELGQAACQKWPDVERVAVVHRVGEVPISESAVVVVVSSPHRSESFEAARFMIDTLKSTVPIWKREAWDGGESWGLEANDITSVPTDS